MWFHNLLCHEDIIVSATSFVSIVAWVYYYNVSRSQLQILYLILYRWLRTANCQLVLDIFEQIVHLWLSHQWSLDQRSLMLILNNSFSSYIVLATAECTVFVIDESSVINDHKSSSCSDNNESCLDS